MTRMLITVLLVFLVSCGYEQLGVEDLIVAEKHDYSFAHSIEAASLTEILGYIDSEYRLVPDDGYWQLPGETEANGSGDDVDLSISFMYLCQGLGVDSWLVKVRSGDSWYPVVYINDTLGEPGASNYVDIATANFLDMDGVAYVKSNTVWVANYGEVLWMTYHYHMGVGKYY